MLDLIESVLNNLISLAFTVVIGIGILLSIINKVLSGVVEHLIKAIIDYLFKNAESNKKRDGTIFLDFISHGINEQFRSDLNQTDLHSGIHENVVNVLNDSSNLLEGKKFKKFSKFKLNRNTVKYLRNAHILTTYLSLNTRDNNGIFVYNKNKHDNKTEFEEFIKISRKYQKRAYYSLDYLLDYYQKIY